MGSPVPGRSLVSSTFRNFRNGNGSCQSSSTCRFPMQATQREVARTSRFRKGQHLQVLHVFRTGRKVASSKKSSSDKFLTNSKSRSAIGIHCQGPVKRETPRWLEWLDDRKRAEKSQAIWLVRVPISQKPFGLKSQLFIRPCRGAPFHSSSEFSFPGGLDHLRTIIVGGSEPCLHPRSLTARPWKKGCLEDDPPFLLGPGQIFGKYVSFREGRLVGGFKPFEKYSSK